MHYNVQVNYEIPNERKARVSRADWILANGTCSQMSRPGVKRLPIKGPTRPS